MADKDPYAEDYRSTSPAEYESLDNLAAAKAEAQKRADKTGKAVRIFAKEGSKVDPMHTVVEYRVGLDRADVIADARADSFAPVDFVATKR